MNNIYIQIEALVANAFIDLVENKNQREIFYSDLDEYGAKVIDELNREDDVRAILVVSRESQYAVVEDYADMFEAFERDGSKGIRLKDKVEPMDLWKRFCTSLAYPVLLAFRSTEVRRVLGV